MSVVTPGLFSVEELSPPGVYRVHPRRPCHALRAAGGALVVSVYSSTDNERCEVISSTGRRSPSLVPVV